MSKISIIVPVYNDFRYISRCLESLINQTYKNIEIIVVDDGSTDSTPSILQDYANKDSRIKVITQKNQKQGAARNNGLNVATGDYITFIDSDDWIDLDFCQKSYDVITKHNVDIALTSAIRIKENGKFRTYFNFEEETKYDGFNDIAKVNRIPGYWQVWGKLYKRELLEGIKFEEGVFYEDPEYLIKVLYKAKTLATVVGPKYYYFSNPNSTIKAKKIYIYNII